MTDYKLFETVVYEEILLGNKVATLTVINNGVPPVKMPTVHYQDKHFYATFSDIEMNISLQNKCAVLEVNPDNIIVRFEDSYIPLEDYQ